MKNIKTILRAPLTAMLLAAALTNSVAADKEVPFRGSLQAVELFDVQFPTLFVDASGSGNATHLGRFTTAYDEVVDLLTLTSTGFAHFLAANGDSLFTETVSPNPPQFPAPDVISFVVTHTITGGTGRFAGATGSFNETRVVNLVTGDAVGSFSGSIAFNKGKKTK